MDEETKNKLVTVEDLDEFQGLQEARILSQVSSGSGINLYKQPVKLYTSSAAMQLTSVRTGTVNGVDQFTLFKEWIRLLRDNPNSIGFVLLYNESYLVNNGTWNQWSTPPITYIDPTFMGGTNSYRVDDEGNATDLRTSTYRFYSTDTTLTNRSDKSTIQSYVNIRWDETYIDSSLITSGIAVSSNSWAQCAVLIALY